MEKLINVSVQKLSKNAKLPTRGSEYAAGYDLYADLGEDTKQIAIFPSDCVKVSTGIAISLPVGTFGAIFPRSGLATKFGIRPANCVGVIDADYRGPVIVALRNDSDGVVTIENGERIAQLVVIPFYSIADCHEVDCLDQTVRGNGGFGSSGRK